MKYAIHFSAEALEAIKRLEKLKQRLEYEILWGKSYPKKTRRKMKKK